MLIICIICIIWKMVLFPFFLLYSDHFYFFEENKKHGFKDNLNRASCLIKEIAKKDILEEQLLHLHSNGYCAVQFAVTTCAVGLTTGIVFVGPRSSLPTVAPAAGRPAVKAPVPIQPGSSVKYIAVVSESVA